MEMLKFQKLPDVSAEFSNKFRNKQKLKKLIGTSSYIWQKI